MCVCAVNTKLPYFEFAHPSGLGQQRKLTIKYLYINYVHEVEFPHKASSALEVGIFELC